MKYVKEDGLDTQPGKTTPVYIEDTSPFNDTILSTQREEVTPGLPTHPGVSEDGLCFGFSVQMLVKDQPVMQAEPASHDCKPTAIRPRS